MNLKWIIRRFRRSICIYGSLLTAILLSVFLYFKDDDYDDIFNQPEENWPFDGPPYFFIIPELKDLNLKTACAIEAAAFHHPQSKVTVYTLIDSKDFQLHNIFENISNVNIQSISISQVFNNTPLQELFQTEITSDLINSQVFITYALVLALISKHGGVYLSNDMWCLKTISEFRNLIFLEKESYLFSAAILFDRWHRLPTLAMKNLRDLLKNKFEFSKDIFKLVLKNFCVANYGDFLVILNYPVENCVDTRFVLSPELIFPVVRNDRKFLFINKSIEFLDSYSFVKVWDNLSEKIKVKPDSGVILDSLAQRICNKVYNAMRKQEV